MTGLAEWLLEAITEDEAAAHGVYSLSMYWRTTTGGHDFGPGVAYFEEPADAVHVARWSPARVLAECAAKRAIIELHGHEDAECWEMHRGVYGPGWPEGSGRVEGQAWAHPSLEYREQEPCDTLRLLAAPYADRPGFREEWRV